MQMCSFSVYFHSTKANEVGIIGRGGQTGAYVCPLKWFLLIFLLLSIQIINVLSVHDIVQEMTCQMEHYELCLWPLFALHCLSPLIKRNRIDQIMETLRLCEKANKTIPLPVIRIWPSHCFYDCINMAAADEMDLLHPTVWAVSPVPASDTWHRLIYNCRMLWQPLKKSHYIFSQSPLRLHLHLVLL